jgi:AbrB family looped-hinge helix DNA binding protein
MSISESSRIGKRGTFVIPARLRRRFGLSEGTTVIAEETEEGILLRPAITLPIESYSSERRAEFLLSNAINDDDYARAREAVREMGIDPDSIEHHRP